MVSKIPTDEFLEYLKPRYNRDDQPAFCCEIGTRMHKVCRRAFMNGHLRLVRSGMIKAKSRSMYYEMYRLAHHVSLYDDYIEEYSKKRRDNG